MDTIWKEQQPVCFPSVLSLPCPRLWIINVSWRRPRSSSPCLSLCRLTHSCVGRRRSQSEPPGHRGSRQTVSVPQRSPQLGGRQVPAAHGSFQKAMFGCGNQSDWSHSQIKPPLFWSTDAHQCTEKWQTLTRRSISTFDEPMPVEVTSVWAERPHPLQITRDTMNCFGQTLDVAFIVWLIFICNILSGWRKAFLFLFFTAQTHKEEINGSHRVCVSCVVPFQLLKRTGWD